MSVALPPGPADPQRTGQPPGPRPPPVMKRESLASRRSLLAPLHFGSGFRLHSQRPFLVLEGDTEPLKNGLFGFVCTCPGSKFDWAGLLSGPQIRVLFGFPGAGPGAPWVGPSRARDYAQCFRPSSMIFLSGEVRAEAVVDAHPPGRGPVPNFSKCASGAILGCGHRVGFRRTPPCSSFVGGWWFGDESTVPAPGLVTPAEDATSSKALGRKCCLKNRSW